jgi:hypothetical protein
VNKVALELSSLICWIMIMLLLSMILFVSTILYIMIFSVSTIMGYYKIWGSSISCKCTELHTGRTAQNQNHVWYGSSPGQEPILS